MMDQNKLLSIKHYLNTKNKHLPKHVIQDPFHWNSRIYMANLLQETGDRQAAYEILRGIYEDNIFEFSKEVYATYEEYIIEKVKFFQQLAQLSIEVTKEPAQSLPYLDEALIMLDGEESVYSYVDPKQILDLKKAYLNQLG